MRCLSRAPGPLVLLVLVAFAGCVPAAPPPRPGLVEFEALALVDVPGGRVNAIGRGGLIHRVDLSIDTWLGTREIGATWNTASSAWHWSFDLRYDGRVFVDGSGARHDLRGVANGEAVPGTGWVRLAPDRLSTKGGWIHTFDSDGALASIRWASSAYPRLVHHRASVAGAVATVRIDQCRAPGDCDLVFELQRDGAGRVVRIDDRAGRHAAFTYDAAGHLVAARDGLDTARDWPGFRYEYAGGQLRAVTNSEGERVEWECSPQGHVGAVRRVGPDAPVWRFRGLRAGSGFATELVDPTGARTLVTYDGRRRVRSIENGEGEATLFTWSGLRPASRVAADGTRTEWTYEDDDLVETRASTGLVTRIAYAPGGVRRDRPMARAMARVEDDLGIIERRHYDAAGRLVAFENGAGELTAFGYDTWQMLSSVTRPDGRETRYHAHGVHGHATEWTDPAGTFRPRYDAVGNQLTGPDPGSEADPMHGGIRARGYDEDRNLATLSLAEGHPQVFVPRVLTIEYRSDGRRLAIRRPYGGDSTFHYDGLGGLVERRDRSSGAWRVTRMERDAVGRLTAIERPNGMRLERDYDAAGRIATRRVLRDGQVESEVQLGFADGRLVRIDESLHGAPERLRYDAHGRVARVEHPGGEQTWHFYDARSRPVSTWYVDSANGFARTFGTSYDAAGRVRTRRDGGRALVSRDIEDGRVERIRYANGLERELMYGATGSLRGTETRDEAGTLRAWSRIDRGCVYLGPNCLNQEVWTGGPAAGSSHEEYSLAPASDRGAGRDGGGRLDREVSGMERTAFFVFDALSNERGRVELDPACNEDRISEYDAEHSRLSRVLRGPCGDLTYTYDEAGFVTARNAITLDWDGAGRIRRVGDHEFVWDTLGRPLARWGGGRVTLFRFGGAIEADASGRPRHMDVGDVRLDLVGGEDRVRHRDVRENTSFVTDEEGRTLVHYQYEAYRLRGVVAGDAQATDRRFAQGLDLGELVLLGHRVLDATVGRFLAPDPVFQLLNQYAYTLGNPVLYGDLDGRYQVTLSRGLAIASLAVGVAALAVTAPATATVLGVASLALGAASLAVDALEELAGQDARPATSCPCASPSPPTGRSGHGTPGAAPGPGSLPQLKLLEIGPDLGGLGGLGAGLMLDFNFNFSFVP